MPPWRVDVDLRSSVAVLGTCKQQVGKTGLQGSRFCQLASILCVEILFFLIGCNTGARTEVVARSTTTPARAQHCLRVAGSWEWACDLRIS